MEIIENPQEQTETFELTDQQIFTEIWTSPRMVFKYINDFKHEKYLIPLLFLAGVARAFDRAITKNMGDDMSLVSVVATSIILGGLLGWIWIYIYSALMSWTGEWLNGKGNLKSLFRMTAHAMIPSIVGMVFLIPQIALFGNGIFQSGMDLDSMGWYLIVVFYGTLILQGVLSIWTLILFVIGVSEVQKLSIGKSIVNIFLPALIILIPIAIFILIL